MFLYLSNNIYRKAVFMFNLLISDVYQHEFETFFHLLCFDHHGKIQTKKMFTHADSDILQYLYILSTFLNSVYANCLWYSFKIHSSFDDKHVNVYKVVHVLAFFRQIPKCISHQFFKGSSKKWRLQHQSRGSCVPC